MSVIATALKHMLAAGMPHDAIVSAVEAMEAARPVEKVRSKGAERQARYEERKRQKASESVSSDGEASEASAPPFPSSPPAPPQLPIPPSGSVTTRERVSDGWPDGQAMDHARTLGQLNPRIDPNRKPGLITSLGEIARWRQQGFSWGLDVIPVITAHAAKARADPVGAWTYFSPAIAQAHANRTRPAEAVTPQASHERDSAPSDKFERKQRNLAVAAAVQPAQRERFIG